MDTDIRDEIEQCFGDGPPATGTATLLTRGRRALRRRRMVESGAMLAVAAVVVTGAVAAVGRGPATDSAPPAGPPTASSAPSRSSDPIVGASKRVVIRIDASLPDGNPVMIDNNGVVNVAPSIVVHRTVANPFHRRPPTHSAALTYSLDGETYWWVGFSTSQGGGASVNQPARTDINLTTWIEEQAAIQGDGPGDGDPGSSSGGDWPGRVDLRLVRFVGGTERLEPVDAVTLVQQRAHPALPDSWATGDDRSAVAEVRFEGERYYVLARQSDDGTPPQYIVVSAADGGATLDAFLAFADERYTELGGGLL